MAVLTDLMVFRSYACRRSSSCCFFKEGTGGANRGRIESKIFFGTLESVEKWMKVGHPPLLREQESTRDFGPHAPASHDPAGRVPFASPWVLPAVFQTPVDFVPW